jgi:hypothetical protein
MDQFHGDGMAIIRGTDMARTGGIFALVAAAGLMAAPALAADRAPAARLSLAPNSGRAVTPAHRSNRAGHGAASGAIINLGLIAAIGAGVLLATAGRDTPDSK